MQERKLDDNSVHANPSESYIFALTVIFIVELRAVVPFRLGRSPFSHVGTYPARAPDGERNGEQNSGESHVFW